MPHLSIPRNLRSLFAIALFVSPALHVAADCNADCASVYPNDPSFVNICTEACESFTVGEFDASYPYPYPETTNSDPAELANLTGTMYARVDINREKMQFYYVMDDNPSPFYPYFAMHLHHGNLNAEEIGGHIVVSIAGKGDIIGCVAPRLTGTGEPEIAVCSELCTPGSVELGACVNPTSNPAPLPQECPICGFVAAAAYFCQGGCQGDRRILGYNVTNPDGSSTPQTLAPSRFCDLDNDNPSNPLQGQWIQGRHSHEFSGNPLDGKDYSPYSIGIPEIFDLWCGHTLPFLVDEVFADGAASYVALHGDFNATGTSSLVYGNAFAAISTSSGGAQNCTIFGIPGGRPCSEGYQSAAYGSTILPINSKEKPNSTNTTTGTSTTTTSTSTTTGGTSGGDVLQTPNQSTSSSSISTSFTLFSSLVLTVVSLLMMQK